MLRRKRLIGRIVVVAAVLATAYFLVSWYIVGQALQAEISEFEHHPNDFAMEFRDVEFTPRGDPGITLRGWWFPREDAIATIIWVHGLDSNRAERIPLIRDLLEQGFAALVFVLRGHGESDHVPIGAGYYEPRDVRGAIDFAVGKLGAEPGRVLLMGHSFGAAIVLMSGVGETAVVGVYADSGFASLADLIVQEVEDRTPIPAWGARLLRPGIVLVGAWLKGVDIDAVRPEEVVAGYDYLVGLTHCLEDDRIPFNHSVRIWRETSVGSWFNAYPDCGHVEAYEIFPERYVSIVTDYFYERLGIDPQ